jgi:hypothetical protein
MKNFYTNTGTHGYIRLNTIPDKPVKLSAGQEVVVRFMNAGRKVSEQKVIFSSQVGGDNFRFTIPASDLELSKEYTLQLVRRAAKPSTNNTVEGPTAGTAVTSGTATTVEDKEEIILEYPFSTSGFRTFWSKMAALR